MDDDELIKAHLGAKERSYDAALASTEAGRAIAGADTERRARLAANALKLWSAGLGDAGRVASDLLRANGKDWTPERLVDVLDAAAAVHRGHEFFTGYSRFPFKPLISAVEKAAGSGPMPTTFRAALEKWKAAVSPRELTPDEERKMGEAGRIAMDDDNHERLPWSQISDAFATVERLERIRTPLTEERKLIDRLTALLAKSGNAPGESDALIHISTDDAVGAAMAAARVKGGPATGSAWTALLQHSLKLNSVIPNKRWSEEAARLVAQIKADVFTSCVSEWFNLAGKPRQTGVAQFGHAIDDTLLTDGSVQLLKGLAWAVAAAGHAELAPALGNLAEACFHKIPNKGPRNVKVANAAVAALGALASPEAAAQLTRLQLRVKHRSSRAMVEKGFTVASEKSGLSPDELAERSLPTFGLGLVQSGEMGCYAVRGEALGEHTAELFVSDSRSVGLRFYPREKKKGREKQPTGSIPSVIRREHGEALTRLKREIKDASLMLTSQALRLERFFVGERKWPFELWRERYLEHPLVGTLARRLIWRFDDALAIPYRDGFVTADDRKFEPKAGSSVSLWHPIQSPVEVVLGWRQWLERHEVCQPFKQAHREIYALTDAERRTESYSNRFAAHILRQHQFTALCHERGWEYNLQGDFDSANSPTLKLPAHGLRAEFWVEPITDQLTPRGMFLFVTTDQVRFRAARRAGVSIEDEDEAARNGTYEPPRTPKLPEIPAIVFSEVMRDVDFFVGVASVANDPTWHDNAPPFARGRDYWRQFSFGELSETAMTRRALLERLLPRLAASRQFSLERKFLVVRGSLRTYKIHLGSGNVLMEPNDQYLCIVRAPTRAEASGLFLPFEGDSTMALILSKAFLLAGDERITDPSITRQIRS